MAIEVANFISQLDATNPPGSDFVQEGDNHLRLTKSVLKGTFPNANVAFRFPDSKTIVAGTVNPNINDHNSIIPVNASAASRTVNLPDAGTIHDGYTVGILKTDNTANTIVVDPAGATLVNGQTSLTMRGQFAFSLFRWVESMGQWASMGFVEAGGIVQQWDIGGTLGVPALFSALPGVLSQDPQRINFPFVASSPGLALPAAFTIGEYRSPLSCAVKKLTILQSHAGAGTVLITKTAFSTWPTGPVTIKSQAFAAAQKVEVTVTDTITAGDVITASVTGSTLSERISASLEADRYF